MHAVDSVRKFLLDKELFPLLNAESVLLIRDDERQVRKLYIIGKKRVRSYNDGSFSVS